MRWLDDITDSMDVSLTPLVPTVALRVSPISSTTSKPEFWKFKGWGEGQMCC